MSGDSIYVNPGTYQIHSDEFAGQKAQVVVAVGGNAQLIVNGQVASTGIIVPGGEIDGKRIADIEQDSQNALIWFEGSSRTTWLLFPEATQA